MMTKNMKIKKRFLLRFSPFFCPDLGEDQKRGKGLHQDSVRFYAQIFYPNSKGGSYVSILRAIPRYSNVTGDPKEGAMAQSPTS